MIDWYLIIGYICLFWLIIALSSSEGQEIMAACLGAAPSYYLDCSFPRVPALVWYGVEPLYICVLLWVFCIGVAVTINLQIWKVAGSSGYV